MSSTKKIVKSSEISVQELQKISKKIRVHILNMLSKAGSGHPGGSLSATDLLTALFFCKMNHDSSVPDWVDRDRFVLSKGHACPALYAVLAESGYFDIKELDGLRKFGSILQGHPDMKRVPGIDISSGSLGQGLSVAVGMALSAKVDKKEFRVYAMLGDGEIQEGQIWEAAMAAGHYKTDNLCAILDNNGYQIDGAVSEIMSPNPIPDKWKAFGWHVIAVDGHNMEAILEAYDTAKTLKGKPTIIIAKTIKGKGVSFMEEAPADWHGSPLPLERADEAIAEIK